MDTSPSLPPPVGAPLSPFSLNLRHLRGLLAVCEEGSISAAAQVMNLSQPALTQGIVKLEGQLGVTLFERRSDGMVATSVGELVEGRVRAALEHLATGGRWLAGPNFQPERRVTMAQLRALLALTETGSFASAADRISLSQTAVHRAVRELEEALHKKLVERRGRTVQPNFGGRRFARHVRLAIHEIQAAFSELGIDAQSSTVTLGTTPLARAFIVPEAMALMAGSEVHAGFQVFEGGWGELIESLRDGIIDMVVGELPAHDSPDLAKTPLYEDSLIIAAGRQHPLAGLAQPSLETLAMYPWIIAPENSPLRTEFEQLFAGKHRPQAPIECGSIMIIGRLLTSTKMLTLATPDQVALQIRSGLLARVGAPLTGLQHTIGITMRQGWRPTRAQLRFLEFLREASKAVGATAMAVTWNSDESTPAVTGLPFSE